MCFLVFFLCVGGGGVVISISINSNLLCELLLLERRGTR